MHRQRLPARGPRGEAVSIIRTGDEDHRQGQHGDVDLIAATYWLASGERLQPTDDPKVFQDSEGRRFTLDSTGRHASSSEGRSTILALR